MSCISEVPWTGSTPQGLRSTGCREDTRRTWRLFGDFPTSVQVSSWGTSDEKYARICSGCREPRPTTRCSRGCRNCSRYFHGVCQLFWERILTSDMAGTSSPWWLRNNYGRTLVVCCRPLSSGENSLPSRRYRRKYGCLIRSYILSEGLFCNICIFCIEGVGTS